MLVVETIAKIRRAHFVQMKSIKAICRELKVSRKVVRKVVRSGATAFEYERSKHPMPRLGPWTDELERLLAANEAKPARERLTLMRLFEELRGLGYEGGYDAVRRYARRWQRERSSSLESAFVPLSFAPGEAYQFDVVGADLLVQPLGRMGEQVSVFVDGAGPGRHPRLP
jgi:transposase